MIIQPGEITRVILFVSPARSTSEGERPSYEDTIAFKCLSHIASNQYNEKTYYYWLIYTEQSKETAEFLDKHFADSFEVKNIDERLFLISSVDSANEIYELIMKIVSQPTNANKAIYCDCTGGTKTMSIAMALACNHFNLTTGSQTNLILTFVPPKDFDKDISFHKYDLSRLILEEQHRYIQQQNRLGRMQYLARFSSILAHEIKNPLNLISADLYLLRNKYVNEYSQQLIQEVEASVNEITHIIDNVQQVVRGEADASLIPVIQLREVIRRLKLRTEVHFPSLNFQIKGDLTDVKLRIAEEKLYTIFANLIDNAAKATHGTGTITFEFKTREDKIIVDVYDDGPGIPPELRSTLFKPMRRGKNTTGTGMGLHIVKIFISEEGGNIHYDDTYPGARFLIELPIYKSED